MSETGPESNFNPSPDYLEREKRVSDAVKLIPPDRVPIASLPHYYPTRVAGLSNKEAINDHAKCFQVWKEFTIQTNMDLAPTPVVNLAAQPCTTIGLTQYKWPGDGLPDDAPHQYVEKEYLLESEYDEFLSNPGDFAVRKLWPRMAKGFEPLALLPPLHLFLETRNLVFGGGALAGMPPFIELLQNLLKLGQEVTAYNAALSNYTLEMAELGYPFAFSAGARSPFDYLSDFLRGLKGSSLDMYRVPDKLLKAVELLTPVSYQTGIMGAQRSGNPRVFLTLHRGAGGFMSDEQFAKFYWPGLKNVLLALVDAGLTPMPFFEGDYTPRLEYLAELPKGKIVGHFDVIDRQKAKKIIGDTMCFWGNVPAHKLIIGTPEQVKDDVKELIDTFADNGGLIVDASVGIPDEAKPENVAAMIETVFEYGSA